MTERWAKMVEKYGSEEKAKIEMKRRADLSKRNKGGTGGFASMDKEKLAMISSVGGKAGKRGKKT